MLGVVRHKIRWRCLQDDRQRESFSEAIAQVPRTLGVSGGGFLRGDLPSRGRWQRDPHPGVFAQCDGCIGVP